MIGERVRWRAGLSFVEGPCRRVKAWRRLGHVFDVSGTAQDLRFCDRSRRACRQFDLGGPLLVLIVHRTREVLDLLGVKKVNAPLPIRQRCSPTVGLRAGNGLKKQPIRG